MHADSGVDGPVVWLTACAHGDEVGGSVVTQEIFRRLRKTPLKAGMVYAFPLMNPLGFETGSRHVTLSEEDLNRCFPGSPTGTVAERLAERIFSKIMETSPTVVLDLHTDWRRSMPYVVIDHDPGPRHREIYRTTKRFARTTGFLMIMEREAAHHSLSYSLLTHGIPALTVELGESSLVNEVYVEHGIRAVWNVLGELGMVESSESPYRYPLPKGLAGRILPYSGRPYSSTSGILRFLVGPGDMVERDQPIARVSNAFGKLQETIVAPRPAIVLGHADSSVVFPGMPVMAFGVLDG